MYLWRKLAGPRQDAAWIARLTAAAGASRLATITPAGGHPARWEVYCEKQDEARALARQFGGRVLALPDSRWQPPPATVRGRPLSLGGRLLVTAWPDELAALRSSQAGKKVLCIPAAMAFGTGEHATTAMCVRLLAAISRGRQAGAWEALDLGTGSGILALAARMLGARHVRGLDNDGDAIRTARENARLNGLSGRTVVFERADLLAWCPRRRWPLIVANLFSGLLIRLVPKVIAPALVPGGDLILSGVLAEQADEVTAAIRQAGLQLAEVKSRGRWRAFHAVSEQMA